MSIRAFGTRLFKNGTTYIRHYYRGKPYARKINQPQNTVEQISAHFQQTSNVNTRYVLRNICIQVGQQVRRILIDNTFNQLRNKYGTELFQKAKQRVLYGNSVPLLSLVGITVASGQSILTRDEELEGVCWEIRECLSKIQEKRNHISENSFLQNISLNIDSFSFGKPIAKGSNAVVYSVDLLSNQNTKEVKEFDYIKNIPLALKMMFNYDVQSNSIAILKAMYRETVPAGGFFNNCNMINHNYEFLSMTKYLPEHPNIVKILGVFSDFVPDLNECRELYPAALPKRIYPDGEGRNMSLFILMKRYDKNLQEFLKTSQLTIRTSVFLLAQLLEGIIHMNSYNIAHRDLKTDNILLDVANSETPLAVISDFGCCLAEGDLIVPYSSYDIDKGGNTALMAPEIITKKPGSFAKLNYSKSDLWAVGAIAYEIFGISNPFYGNKRLYSTSYKENELPNLPDGVPVMFNKLIKNLLMRNPRQRLDADIAANICQLFLWAPTSWLDPGQKLPSLKEILEWFLNLAAKIVCEGGINKFSQEVRNKEEKKGCIAYSEYLLVSSFLCRAKLLNIKLALDWIHNNYS